MPKKCQKSCIIFKTPKLAVINQNNVVSSFTKYVYAHSLKILLYIICVGDKKRRVWCLSS